MSNNPQREINARFGRTGSRLATPGAGGLGGVPAQGAAASSGAAAGGTGVAGSGAPAPGASGGLTVKGFFGVFRYSHRAIQLVWSTSAVLTISLGLLTVVAGVLPAAIAYVGSLIVDAVVGAMRAGGANSSRVVEFVVLEGVLVATVAAVQRGISLCQSLLRAQLGQRVNVMILEKALTLELQHFEDSEFYDKLTRARREASSCLQACPRSLPKPSSPAMPSGCFAGVRPRHACRFTWRP